MLREHDQLGCSHLKRKCENMSYTLKKAAFCHPPFKMSGYRPEMVLYTAPYSCFVCLFVCFSFVVIVFFKGSKFFTRFAGFFFDN